MRVAALSLALLLSSAIAAAGPSGFSFAGWDGPPIRVRLYVPEAATPTTPIVIVMHGQSRDVERYFADWSALAEERGFIAVVPHFPKTDFPGSRNYNLGNVVDPKSGARRAESEWTFSAIEPMFDAVVAALGGDQDSYSLYGHSAGSQFVHRFLYFKPGARVERYLAANAGWYTMPDFDTAYPYGLDGAGIDRDALADAFGKDVVLLLGREDTDHTDSTLRNTREAKRQGANRFLRGLTMYAVAKDNARKLGAEFNWRVVVVDDAGHVNAEMARAAALLVE